MILSRFYFNSHPVLYYSGGANPCPTHNNKKIYMLCMYKLDSDSQENSNQQRTNIEKECLIYKYRIYIFNTILTK
jgi:hypothetical protein